MLCGVLTGHRARSVAATPSSLFFRRLRFFVYCFNRNEAIVRAGDRHSSRFTGSHFHLPLAIGHVGDGPTPQLGRWARGCWGSLFGVAQQGVSFQDEMSRSSWEGPFDELGSVLLPVCHVLFWEGQVRRGNHWYQAAKHQQLGCTSGALGLGCCRHVAHVGKKT